MKYSRTTSNCADDDSQEKQIMSNRNQSYNRQVGSNNGNGSGYLLNVLDQKQNNLKYELLSTPELARSTDYYSKKSVGQIIPEEQEYIENRVRAEIAIQGISAHANRPDGRYDNGLPTASTASRYISETGLASGVYDRMNDQNVTGNQTAGLMTNGMVGSTGHQYYKNGGSGGWPAINGGPLVKMSGMANGRGNVSSEFSYGTMRDKMLAEQLGKPVRDGQFEMAGYRLPNRVMKYKYAAETGQTDGGMHGPERSVMSGQSANPFVAPQFHASADGDQFGNYYINHAGHVWPYEIRLPTDRQHYWSAGPLFNGMEYFGNTNIGQSISHYYDRLKDFVFGPKNFAITEPFAGQLSFYQDLIMLGIGALVVYVLYTMFMGETVDNLDFSVKTHQTTNNVSMSSANESRVRPKIGGHRTFFPSQWAAFDDVQQPSWRK